VEIPKSDYRNNENMSLESGAGSKKNLFLNGALHQKNVNQIKID